MKSIFFIEEYINSLNGNEREIIKKIYEIENLKTEMKIPSTFEKKVIKYISEDNIDGMSKDKIEEILDSVRKQKILKIMNRWTYESALYNYLRAYRPGVNIKGDDKFQLWIKTNIEDSSQSCDFCEPEKYTPEDSFGRISGKHCITAANLARFDRFHSLLIFKKHNPLDFSEEELSDYISTGFKWFSKVEKISSEYKFQLLLWNCLPRAGASQIHGHMQMLAAKAIYPRMQYLLNSAKKFRQKYGVNYFDALYQVHNSLGLSIENDGIRILCYLTPVKENEIFIISKTANRMFVNVLYKILRKFIDELKVLSFNLSLYKIPADNEGDYFFLTRIVDRGNILSKTSDIASMELYASSVIAHDPIKLHDILSKKL